MSRETREHCTARKRRAREQPTFHYEAWVWEQQFGFVRWSRHRTYGLARAAASKYMRRLAHSGPAAGGALSWSGGFRHVGSRMIVWICPDGSEVCT